jgi:hypothetical protein
MTLASGHKLGRDVVLKALPEAFLMLKPVTREQAAPKQINVVLNWSEELKCLVPVGTK